MAREGQPGEADYFELAFAKRPAEELYVLADDPYNLRNEVGNPRHAQALAELRKSLQNWMEDTGDLRVAEPQTDYWDKLLYTPDYQMEDEDWKAGIQAYRQAVVEGGTFAEKQCE